MRAPSRRGWAVHAASGAAHLDLLLVEHPQPLEAEHVGQALPEGQAVLPDLPVEPVVRHQVDVGDAVGTGDWDVLPTEFQFHNLWT